MKDNCEIRKMNREEVAFASDLADAEYPEELYESLDCFRNKREFYPDGFLGLFIEGKFSGYIICHPWRFDREVPLDYVLKAEDGGDIFYLHDLVIDKNQRGKGYGSKMMKKAVDLGEKNGFRRFMLVAVNERAKKIAEKLGFAVEKNISYNGIPGWRMIR